MARKNRHRVSRVPRVRGRLAAFFGFVLSVAAFGCCGGATTSGNAVVGTPPPTFLATPGMTYVLDNDVACYGTCFAILADNVTLDLNGHTIVYDNAPRPTLLNGDFEVGSGNLADHWDFTTAPDAQRIAGHYVKPVTSYSGDYALRFSLPAADQFLRNDEPVLLEPNRTYSISGMAHVMGTGYENLTLSIELDGTGAKAVQRGVTWRGFQYIYATYRTGPTPESRHVVLRLSGASQAGAGYVYLDDVRIQRHGLVGVAVGPAEWNAAAVPGVGRYGIGRGAVIKNGKIVQGVGNSDRSHAIYIEETSGSGYTVDGVEITVSGANSKAFFSLNAVNAKISNNTIHGKVSAISSRDNYDGALVKIEYPARSVEISNNVIDSGVQTGIFATLAAGSAPGKIHGNRISLQTRYSNDFAIVGGGHEVFENIVDCGAGSNSCRGIAGTWVHNNTVTVRELERNQEYDGCELGGAYGIQLEDTSNANVYQNVVTAVSDVCPAYAMRLNPKEDSGVYGRNNQVYGNEFITRSDGRADAASIRIADADPASMDIRDNILDSNAGFISFDGIGKGIVFAGNLFRAAPGLPAAWYPLRTSSAGLADNIVILDARYADPTSATAIANGAFRRATDFAVVPSASYDIAWDLTVTVQDSSGVAVSGAAVSATDSLGGVYAQVLTDSNGEARLRLPEVHNVGGVKTALNPYTVNATDGVRSGSQQIVVDAAKPLTIAIQ